MPLRSSLIGPSRLHAEVVASKQLSNEFGRTRTRLGRLEDTVGLIWAFWGGAVADSEREAGRAGVPLGRARSDQG
eukprot:380387-Pyramimonas_sp.AAC.1